MGASQTKVKKDIEELNSTDIGLSQETFNKVKNQCESSVSQSNVLNIIGSTVTKLKTSQTNVAKNMCVLQTAIETVKDADAQNQLMSKLTESVKQNAVAGIGYASTDEDTKIKRTNEFKASVSQKEVNEAITGCIMQQSQENVMNIIGSSVTDSDLSQLNNSIIDCISNYGGKSLMEAGAKSDTTSDTTSSSEATAKGMNPLGDLMALMAGPWGISSLIVCLIVSCIVVSLFMGGAGGAGGGGSGEIVYSSDMYEQGLS
jgi:hypothetical protein